MIIWWGKRFSAGSVPDYPSESVVKFGEVYDSGAKTGTYLTNAEAGVDPGLETDLLGNIDDILSIRDELGVGLKKVYLVARTWSGAEVGAGTFTEIRSRLLPSPKIVEFKHDLKLTTVGQVNAGDIMLKSISRHTYSQETLEGSDLAANVELFYEVGGVIYRVISVVERHVTWRVLLREHTDQNRE